MPGVPPEVPRAAALLPARPTEARKAMETFLRRRPKSLEGIKVFVDASVLEGRILPAVEFLKSIGQTNRGRSERVFGMALLDSHKRRNPKYASLDPKSEIFGEALEDIMRYRTSETSVWMWRVEPASHWGGRGIGRVALSSGRSPRAFAFGLASLSVIS